MVITCQLKFIVNKLPITSWELLNRCDGIKICDCITGSSCCHSTWLWSVLEFQSYICDHLDVPSSTHVGPLDKDLLPISPRSEY